MAEREIYKGIEFIRISKLSTDQKAKIVTSFPKDKVIKILKDEVLLSDCIQYHEYQEWASQHYLPIVNRVSIKPLEEAKTNLLNHTTELV